MQRSSIKSINTMAILVAMEIILSRYLSINIWSMKIGLGFVPVVMAAILFGGVSAGIIAGLSDFLGAVLFPIGPYFPGFTAVAFLQGLIFGKILHEKYSFRRVLLAAFITQIVCTLLLNTWNISFLYGTPYIPLLIMRLVQAGALFVFQILVIPWLYKVAKLIRKQVGVV